MHSQWPMGLKALASPPQSHTAHSPPATGYLWGSSHLSRVTIRYNVTSVVPHPQSTLEPTGWHSGGPSWLWVICLATLSHKPAQCRYEVITPPQIS